MDFQIRKGGKADIPAIFQLVYELADFENGLDNLTNTPEQMEKDWDRENPLYDFFVVENEAKEIIGTAIYYMGYSTWRGAFFYLEDLYVQEKYRGHGIGSKLFDFLIREAKKQGAKRMGWQVLDWNKPAIEFYKKLQAEFDDEWINVRLSEAQINNH